MRKKKNTKKIVLLIVVIFVLTLIGTGLYFVLEKGNITKPNYDDYYSEYVITNKESKIYIKDNDEYKETGLIGKNIELSTISPNRLDNIALIPNPFISLCFSFILANILSFTKSPTKYANNEANNTFGVLPNVCINASCPSLVG